MNEQTGISADQKPKPKLSRLEKLEQRKAQIENKIKAIQAQENEKAQRKGDAITNFV